MTFQSRKLEISLFSRCFEVFTPFRAPPWLLRVGSPRFQNTRFFRVKLIRSCWNSQNRRSWWGNQCGRVWSRFEHSKWLSGLENSKIQCFRDCGGVYPFPGTPLAVRVGSPRFQNTRFCRVKLIRTSWNSQNRCSWWVNQCGRLWTRSEHSKWLFCVGKVSFKWFSPILTVDYQCSPGIWWILVDVWWLFKFQSRQM